MFKKIIFRIINSIERNTNKKIVIVNKETFLPNNTAALSEYGFWYAGNIFNTADISYGIAINGSVEKEETKLVIKILEEISKTNNCVAFYDVGANSGYYGILAAYLYGEKAKVYSFEPLEEYIDCIKKNIYLNKLDNLKIFEFGLGNKNEKKIMYLAGSGSSLEEGFSGENISTQREIDIKKLDDVV